MPDNPWEDGQSEAENAPGAANAIAQMELVRSYAAFAWRAIRPRWVISVAIFTVGMVITILVLRYAPRTYTCTTVLMAIENPVLDANGGQNPLAGAASLITRQENLETLVRETGLVQKFVVRRPTLMALKDRAIQSMFGQWSEKTQAAILVGTLGSKLSVGMDTANNLSISVSWTDGKTAAELAEAAREGFLRTRHAAEISAFEAKMSILDEHATKMRAEVETLAEQINAAHAEERARELTKAGAAAVATGAAPIALPSLVQRRPSSLSSTLGAELPEQKTKLAELKRQLAELEADRDKRLRDEKAKLTELQLHLTPSHPQVVIEQERIAILSQVPSDVALLRSEVADLEGTIKQREALAAHGSSAIGGGSVVAAGAGVPAALPTEIIQALESDHTDPALTAQISGAVVRYGSLRDEIRAGRMQLDTAQAAFDHRYQIVVPAEVPDVPTKPKPALIFGAGFALSLLLALLVPILSELRRGIVIERWQVQQMALPVLAELKLPPHSAD
jgi:uncharacterized protein involved in exopolysaccharide biosynthesis